MATPTLDDIRNRINELSMQINAPADLLPTHGYSRDGGYPHIEADSNGLLHYVIVERGQELERRTTNNVDDLLYWVFAGITFSMACHFELKNRIEDKDSRRMIFDKQEMLLGVLSDAWRQKEREAHAEILQKRPFDDRAGLRAIYCGQLRRQGYPETEIIRIAYEKYPKNTFN